MVFLLFLDKLPALIYNFPLTRLNVHYRNDATHMRRSRDTNTINAGRVIMLLPYIVKCKMYCCCAVIIDCNNYA